MFTIEDIKPLVKVEGAAAVLIKIPTGYNLDPEMKKIISTQIKKATKLPVVFIPAEFTVEVTTDGEKYASAMACTN